MKAKFSVTHRNEYNGQDGAVFTITLHPVDAKTLQGGSLSISGMPAAAAVAFPLNAVVDVALAPGSKKKA